MKILSIAMAGMIWLTSASSATTVPLATSSNSISLDTATSGSCLPSTVEHFSRHTIFRIGNHPRPKFALITQAFDVGQGCFEGFKPATVTVTAKSLDIDSGAIGESPIWSFSTDGVFGEVDMKSNGEIYRVDMPGCCGANLTSKFFSLFSGKLVASSTGSMLKIYSTRDHDVRYVSVEDKIASSPQAGPEAMATIFIGDSEAALETLKISSATSFGKEDWWLSELAFKGREASTAHLVFTDFSEAIIHVELHCRCEAEALRIDIPLSRDGFDEHRATVAGPSAVVLKKLTQNTSYQRTAFGSR